jgi:hypothetical protein
VTELGCMAVKPLFYKIKEEGKLSYLKRNKNVLSLLFKK